MTVCRRSLEKPLPQFVLRRRRGLSTLELVLVTPLLLLMMALIINYGTAACWKARCDGAARNCVWSDRNPRRADWMPVPQYWRVPQASQALRQEPDLIALDDPRLQLPVVRGPMPFGATVNSDVLNPAAGFNAGTATIRRQFPMLGKLPQYRYNVENVLLDKGWEFWRMGMHLNAPVTPSRLWVLYGLPPAETSFASQPAVSLIAVLQNEVWMLAALTQERRRFRLYHGCGPADRCRPCTTDLEDIDELVKDYCRTFPPRVQRRMTQYLQSMYNNLLSQLNSQMHSAPPPSAAALAALQARAAQVQQYLSQLQQFNAAPP